MTEKKYKKWDPHQQYLLPPAVQDWLPEDHPVYLLLEVVDQLDLSAIEAKYQSKDPRGTRPYPPKMMTALLLYGYSTGVYSSRKLEKATYEDIPFRVLTGGLHPDHSRISEFRRKHLDELSDMFVQVLQICDRMGLVELGDIALDGTKIQGSASKHKAMSYERMLEQQQKLREEIDELLKQAEKTDQKEDDQFGRDQRGDELPEELRRREQRLAQIEKAKKQLEQEARQARARDLKEQSEGHAETAETTDDETVQKRATTRSNNKARQSREMLDGDEPDSFQTPEGMPKHRPRRQTDGTPTDKAQRNFTDPDSRIMKRNGVYLQGYNAQAAVDPNHQVIVGCGLTNQASDAGNLIPMLEQIDDLMGNLPEGSLADSGYWNPDAAGQAAQMGVDALVATKREKDTRKGPPATGSPPQQADERDKMDHRLRTEEGRQRYSRRKTIVEPVFGQIKEARGFRRFSLRGIDEVRAEWSLVCTGHNLNKLYGVLGGQTTDSGPDGGW